jgi:hypothetical protein
VWQLHVVSAYRQWLFLRHMGGGLVLELIITRLCSFMDTSMVV